MCWMLRLCFHINTCVRISIDSLRIHVCKKWPDRVITDNHSFYSRRVNTHTLVAIPTGGSHFNPLSKQVTGMSNRSYSDEHIHLIVGGVHYSILRSDIQAHPDCYFASAIKDDWTFSDGPIVIERDGISFQHIFVYFFCCRTTMKFTVEGPLELLVDVRREADYYNVTKLVGLCDSLYETKLKDWCIEHPLILLSSFYTLQVDEADATELDALVKSEVYPGCHTGSMNAACYTTEHIVQSLSRHSESHCDIKRNRNLHYFSLKDSYEYYESLQGDLPTMPGVKCGLVNGGLFAITNDGFEQRVAQGAQNTTCVGKIVYILNSTYTGGAITATHNGVSKTITKPGEYLMYTTEFMREVSTVTSGVLVFVTFNLVRRIGLYEVDDVDDLEIAWVKYSSLPSCDTFTRAVQLELNSNDDGVVLCLSTLYPASHFDPTGPNFDTDPDILTDRDATLYEYLEGTFDVTLVTVCVQRYANMGTAYVIGPPPTENNTKTKIIAPFHGFRESFTVHYAGGHYATLYTALHIQSKQA